MCQHQGLLVHVDLDGCLLVLAGGEQPEGLVHEQVFQAVMSEAWGQTSRVTNGLQREAGKLSRPGTGGALSCLGDSQPHLQPRQAPGLTV